MTPALPGLSLAATDSRDRTQADRDMSPGAVFPAPGVTRLRPALPADGRHMSARHSEALAPSDGRLKARRTIGFIDIGTNSVRLMVAHVGPDHSWTVVTLQKELVRLGEDEFGPANRLQPEAMERATVVCRTFVELAQAHGAQEMTAVATAATREAANQTAFLRKLREEAGLDVRVVSGNEEARLVFLGVLAKVNLGARRALVVDIGGGSTEIAAGGAQGADVLDSLKVGAIRLTSEFPDAALGPVSATTWRRMKRRVQVAATHVRRELDGQRIDVAYGTSGTIRNLAAVAGRLNGDALTAPDVLQRADLRRVAKLLCASDLETRRALPGLNPERADIVVAGAAILDALMEDLGLDEIRSLPECGLREGLVLDHLARLSTGDVVPGRSVRERSVARLARSLSVDERHARHVAYLATELFDSAARSRLHKYGPAERELLSHAAILHDAGTMLSYSDHQAHSHYLIRNADLLGFDQREVAIMAAIALFHRKSRPGPGHPVFRELDRDARSVVGLLSAYFEDCGVPRQKPRRRGCARHTQSGGRASRRLK